MARPKIIKKPEKRRRASVQTTALVARARKRSNLTEAAALKVANAEVHAQRNQEGRRINGGTRSKTIQVISDSDSVEALRDSLADMEAGRVLSLDEVARRLHLRRKAPRLPAPDRTD